MAFKYDVPFAQQTPTSDSKAVLCKSFKIDIAGGSGFTTATAYDLGWLPKEAQVISGNLGVVTAVSGGTVSAATLTVSVNGNTFVSAANVFGTGYISNLSSGIFGTISASTDQKITYTPTLTGAGATAGVIYINIRYVV